jgi:hypothetical protein
MRRTLLLVVVAVSALAAAAAQRAPAPPLDAQQICTHEFGEQFKLDPKFAPLTVDLDGDGQEDLVLVATAKNPLSGELDYHYRAIDPYDGYFGWGNVKDTVQFSATSVGTTRYVLVVHNWRAPKEKFVIINLPFDSLEVGRIAIKKRKKTVNTIHAVELGGLGADVYWDGKKYKWEPSSIDQD